MTEHPINTKDSLEKIKLSFIIMLSDAAKAMMETGEEDADAYERFFEDIRHSCTIGTKTAMLDFYDVTRVRLSRETERSLSTGTGIVERCTRYIEEHVYEQLGLEELAKRLFVSKAHLARLFKKETGLTVMDYIRKTKVQTAQQLILQSEEAYVDIAGDLGFCSQSHFIRVFKKETGMTPKEFRDRYVSNLPESA